ncbi:DUF4344 domain-containing metallopeptidase [Thalassotalea fusca]
MNLYLIRLIALVSIFAINSAEAVEEIRIDYIPAKDNKESLIKSQIEKSGVVSSVVTFLNDSFLINIKLSIKFGSDDGPLFDSEKNEIAIPFSFIDEIEKRFKKANYVETGVSVEDAVADALMHTLFHEFAHAIIFMYDIPIVGKEEDAADALATVLLIEYFEDGQEIAISAADLFDLESEDLNVLEDENFWGEHSLDLQRYYNTICHVYGSDPETYSIYLEQSYFSEDRAELCIFEYEKVARSWLKLLKPYMKDRN